MSEERIVYVEKRKGPPGCTLGLTLMAIGLLLTLLVSCPVALGLFAYLGQ